MARNPGTLMGYERKAQRFDVQFGSTFAGDHLAGQGTITNLSSGGCSIESAITLPVDSVIGLNMAVPNGGGRIHIERAVVRWTRGTTFGLEFTDVPARDRDQLHQLLLSLARESEATS